MEELGKELIKYFIFFAILIIIGLYGIYKIGTYIFNDNNEKKHNYSICLDSNCFQADTYIEDENKTIVKFIKDGKTSVIRGKYSIINN